MAKTISGHTAIKYSLDPRIRKAWVPGRPIWIRVARPYTPLFLRLMVLLDQVEQLEMRNTWSFNYRAPRMGGSSEVSDHAGYAIDCWSDGIGAHTWPSKMPKDKAAKISEILKTFRTSDGRYIFGWGASKKSAGVDYPITYRLTKSNDPMHFYIAPGITAKDSAAVIREMGIKPNGTIGK
jgi:hypothetical protein